MSTTASKKSDPPVPAPAPAPAPIEPTSLPSEHIDHAAVLRNEQNLRVATYNSWIAAIDAEIEGQQRHRDERVAAIDTEHQASKAGLLNRRNNIELARQMAIRSLDVYEENANAGPDQAVVATPQTEGAGDDHGENS